ncbi:MAG: hypothetical protein KKG47_13905 [Proteobacteria bacterium]|nr:hypothetical protein [Pseudomonadota bacterium]MBU1739103.1 hypothetical protein [Pseudomonadota bacterium]
MKTIGKFFIYFLFITFSLISGASAASENSAGLKKILVVDSYHPQYFWSQETNKGFCAAMLEFGYFDNADQVADFIQGDSVTTSKALFKKVWMDSKRKNSPADINEISLRIYKTANDFAPDLIFLGDDNAANYIGNQFLDSEIPIVFWGVNNSPLKYRLLDSIAKPGHNVTGVYQSGYYLESMQLLKAIVPGIRKFAILSVHNPTGRSHHKAVEVLARKGIIPEELVETVSTTDFEVWKNRVLELQAKVDAFFITHLTGFRDKNGNYVPLEDVLHWYVSNIQIPETSILEEYIKGGMLCGAVDSGFNQGYRAAAIGNDILANGAKPATYSPVTPTRGPLTVNLMRAETLGITLSESMGIEEYIQKTDTRKDR